MKFAILTVVFINIINYGIEAKLGLEAPNPVFNSKVYEDAIDDEVCREQLSYMLENPMLMLEFYDSSMRIPTGILLGGYAHLGNYHQCLEIRREVPDSVPIEGKYCMLNVPLEQNIQIPLQEQNLNVSSLITEETIQKLKYYEAIRSDVRGGDHASNPYLQQVIFRLAICIPKSCTVPNALGAFVFNITSIGFEYTEEFCRLPNDKLFAPADYVAVILFSLFGLLVILSTSYDIRHTIFLKRDPKAANPLYKSFSAYTNTKRILTFTTVPGALDCLDGIRAISMIWIILGHAFSTHLIITNRLHALQWYLSATSLWIAAAPIIVDTFFTLSGLLLVYTTVGKLTGAKLFRSLHLFYLNRLLRMFPLLATMVLLQASLLNHFADGPVWNAVSIRIERCRAYWWATILHIQNYVSPLNICLDHSWYLAVDVQLYILSPIILYWVLGKKRTAWFALTASLLLSLAIATIYNFINNFMGGFNPSRDNEDEGIYISYYYYNTLTRASPFFVGMIFGYILNVRKGKKVQIPLIQVLLLWILSIATMVLVVYSHYIVHQPDWDNQLVDNILNSFMRPAWALGLGWIILACIHGYGGPVNWFLSLNMWKLPARLSYAMYIFHMPMQYVVGSTQLEPFYFKIHYVVYRFLSDFLLTFIVSFAALVFIDSPISVLIKIAMGPGPKTPRPNKQNDEKTNGQAENNKLHQ